MAQYCDSRILEENWYYWLIGQATPGLNAYRGAGVLLTKVVPSPGGHKPDPFWGNHLKPQRAHCIAVEPPVFFNSYSGEHDKPRYFRGSRPVVCDLPPATSIVRSAAIIDKMIGQGYVLERSITATWEAIVLDLQKMCRGISFKFHQPTEEARADLESEALVQVVNRVKSQKLIYTPGKAPVFNLFTTTIYRIMYSIMNKQTAARELADRHMRMFAALTVKTYRVGKRIRERRSHGLLVAY